MPAPTWRKAISAACVVARWATAIMCPARICFATLRKRRGGKMRGGLIMALRSGALPNWHCVAVHLLILLVIISGTLWRRNVRKRSYLHEPIGPSISRMRSVLCPLYHDTCFSDDCTEIVCQSLKVER